MDDKSLITLLLMKTENSKFPLLEKWWFVLANNWTQINYTLVQVVISML